MNGGKTHTHGRLKAMLSVLMLCAMLISQTAFVSADNSMPDLEDRSASLELDCIFTDGKAEAAIDGFEFTLYKIADVTVTDGSVHYALTSEYASAGVDLDSMNASQSMQYAKTFETIQKSGSLKGTASGISDANGAAKMTDLPLGMYLVRHTASTGTAEKFNQIQPFLMMIPEVGDDGQWLYDVVAFPKPSMTLAPEEPDPPKPTPTPTPTPPKPVIKTGDTSNLNLWICIAGVCVIVIAFALSVLTRKKSDSGQTA